MRTKSLSTVATFLACLLAASSPAMAQEPLKVYAAGSLTAAMTELIKTSGLPADRFAAPVYGPAGAVRESIERGAPADILASADMEQPNRLAQARPGRPVVLFARNRMCALARESLGLTPANLLDRMLDPKVRVVTSTPREDPAGDYAMAIFARAEPLHPGARAALEAKALKLFVPGAKPFAPGHGQPAGVFLADKGDIVLGYCTGSAAVMRDAPGLVSVPVPEPLAVRPDYGLVVLTDNPLANRFVVIVMSQRGQEVLARYGFIPVALAGR